MDRLILIETSTALCSVSLAENGILAAYREAAEPRSHAALTVPLVKEALDRCGLTVRDCSAVCVSKGPGSYTGLRVGSSTAKGLCFGAGLPLLAVGTLDILVAQAQADRLLPPDCRYVVPLLDARRMEVYTAVFRPDGAQLTQTQPCIVSEGSFSDLLAEGPVLFLGDAADKCRPLLTHPNARFVQCCPKASSMLRPALAAFAARRFEDLAYFEPFYLKDFIATISKKSLF